MRTAWSSAVASAVLAIVLLGILIGFQIPPAKSAPTPAQPATPHATPEQIRQHGSAAPPAMESEEVQRGKAVFQQYCATCHGQEGKGDGVSATGLPIKPQNLTEGHILIPLPEHPTEQEIAAAKEKAAKAIADRVKKGEAFDKLAKELSEDPSAKENSGDLDFFTKEQMVPEFSKAAFGMKKDEVSAPVRSKFGYHVIKLTDRKDAETMSLEDAKPQLIAFLQRQKKQSEMEKIFEEIRSKADIKVHLPELPKQDPAAAPAPPKP